MKLTATHSLSCGILHHVMVSSIMSWYHVRGFTKEKPEVVKLYNKKYAWGRYDGPAGHIVFLPVQVSKVVAEGYVLVVAGIYCQQLQFIHYHSSTAWTTPKSSPVLSGVYPAVCCPSATITTT